MTTSETHLSREVSAALTGDLKHDSLVPDRRVAGVRFSAFETLHPYFGMWTIAVALLFFLPSRAFGEDYRCRHCGNTFQFPSYGGDHRSNFIRVHSAVCQPPKLLPPPPPPPPPPNLEEKLLKAKKKAIEEAMRRLEARYEAMLRKQIKQTGDLLYREISKIHNLRYEFESDVDKIEAQLEQLRGKYNVETRKRPLLQKEYKKESLRGERWKRISEHMQARVKQVTEEIGPKHDSLFSSLERLRRQGRIRGPAESLPLPPVPTLGLTAEAVKIPNTSDRSIESTYMQKPLEADILYSGEPALRQTNTVHRAMRYKDLAHMSHKELLDLHMYYETERRALKKEIATRSPQILRRTLELESKYRSFRENNESSRIAIHGNSDIWTPAQGLFLESESKYRSFRENNESSRIAIHGSKRMAHLYKGQVEQYYKDYLVSQARLAVLAESETILEKSLSTKAMATGKALAEEAQAAIENFTPYLSSLKRMKDYGDIMHGLAKPSGYMQRLFEGVRSSLHLHYDTGPADRALENLRISDDKLRGELLDLGLPEDFMETVRHVKAWFIPVGGDDAP